MRAKALIWAVAAALGTTSLGAQAVADSTAFIKAVRDGDGSKATSLLAAPGSTVAKSRDSSNGDTALHIKIRERDANWTRFLLQNGVDPNSANRAGETPLGLATRLGWTEGARLLLVGGARINGPGTGGQTPLMLAVQNLQMAPGARVQLVQILVRAGASPDATDNVGFSARDYARQDRRGAPVLRVLDGPASSGKAAGPVIRKNQ